MLINVKNVMNIFIKVYISAEAGETERLREKFNSHQSVMMSCKWDKKSSNSIVAV